jgi:PTS system nitrogen regulatory IIA component
MAAHPHQIVSWLQPQEILLDVEARDRRHALERAAAAAARRLDRDPESIFRALWQREEAGVTALGRGVATPHAQIEGLRQPMTIYMRTKTPIDFRAPDDKPVSNLLVLLVPAEGDHTSHLLLLAQVGRLFGDTTFRARLVGASTPFAAAGAFAEWTHPAAM